MHSCYQFKKQYASSYFLHWLKNLNAQSPDEEIFLKFWKVQQTSMGRQNDTGNPLNKPQGKKRILEKKPNSCNNYKKLCCKLVHAILEQWTETSQRWRCIIDSRWYKQSQCKQRFSINIYFYAWFWQMKTSFIPS